MTCTPSISRERLANQALPNLGELGTGRCSTLDHFVCRRRSSSRSGCENSIRAQASPSTRLEQFSHIPAPRRPLLHAKDGQETVRQVMPRKTIAATKYCVSDAVFTVRPPVATSCDSSEGFRPSRSIVNLILNARADAFAPTWMCRLVSTSTSPIGLTTP